MAFSVPATSVLFGNSQLVSRRLYHKLPDDGTAEEDLFADSSSTTSADRSPVAGGILQHVFGFLLDDENEEDDDDVLYRSTMEESTHIWNPLNAALCLSLLLSSSAASVPVALVTPMANDLALSHPSTFATTATSAAVLGTAVGKFVNGPLTDVFGARRTSVIYNLLLAAALLVLAVAPSEGTAVWGLAGTEFAYAVQWPCIIVTLATHYRGSATGMYEGGIYLTSLASRLGGLIAIPLASSLVRYIGWPMVACLGAWMALLASAVTYLYVWDSPICPNDPQNPVDPVLRKEWMGARGQHTGVINGVVQFPRYMAFVLVTVLLPSMRHVLGSGIFWIVALAHTGASMVRTSERILGSYLLDTNPEGNLSQHQAAGMTVFLSLGMVTGLVTAGRWFASQNERGRKWLVSRLYFASIVSCYTLAALGSTYQVPMHVPLQVCAFTIAGLGIAVQCYHIPSLVGATFGCDKSLFISYVEGGACLVASYVWRVAVARTTNWMYGWAAVALCLIVSALVMVEFMEHYFCRPRQGGHSYETIVFF